MLIKWWILFSREIDGGDIWGRYFPLLIMLFTSLGCANLLRVGVPPPLLIQCVAWNITILLAIFQEDAGIVFLRLAVTFHI